LFPDGSKLLITDKEPQEKEITMATADAVKKILAEFPGAKPTSSINKLP
jgi:hypothetical protein